MSNATPLGFFERYLSLWVLLCIIAGTLLGLYLPQAAQAVGALQIAQVNLPVGLLIWVMIIPMLMKIDFSSLHEVWREKAGMGVTLVVNWAIKPFTMAFFAWLFVRHLFADWLPAEQIDSYVAGMILLGAAPCTAMVFVWSHLCRGDANFTLTQVALNDLVMVLAFIGAGVWLKFGGIEGFVITSAIDPTALPDPMAKTVARSADGWWLNYRHQPLLWLLPAVGIVGALAAAALVSARRTLSAFVASALAIVGVIGTAGAAMFPFIMPSSSHPNASLTVWDSVSSHLTLGLMFWATLIFMPLIVFYTSWAYRVMRGKLTLAHIRANEHTAY